MKKKTCHFKILTRKSKESAPTNCPCNFPLQSFPTATAMNSEIPLESSVTNKTDSRTKQLNWKIQDIGKFIMLILENLNIF